MTAPTETITTAIQARRAQQTECDRAQSGILSCYRQAARSLSARVAWEGDMHDDGRRTRGETWIAILNDSTTRLRITFATDCGVTSGRSSGHLGVRRVYLNELPVGPCVSPGQRVVAHAVRHWRCARTRAGRARRTVSKGQETAFRPIMGHDGRLGRRCARPLQL